jgi:serine/threonine protein kinase
MTQDDVPPRFAVDFTGVTLLGIYRVDRKIADGGMGSVWLGEDTNLGRKVVVKVPHVRFLGESGFRARFTREIAELVRLEHPSIVRILAQGVHEEIPFFVLQYLGGGSLEERLEAGGDGPRGVDTVVPWLRTIAATLDFVHGRGVVHRDVKPENILFDEEGHVFLSDFGVVKALDENLDVTEAGTGVGSPKYMAPEQGLGQPVEGAADQYGLATTIYEAITGRLPFQGDSALEILMVKLKEPPTPLADLAPDLPPACGDAVMRGLAAEPADRFPSCQEFADAFLAGAGIFDRTPPAGVPVEVPRRGLLLAATLALLAAVVLVVGFASGWFSAAPDEDGTVAGINVILLSPGAEPRRVLRYRPAPGTKEISVTRIITEEAKRFGGQEPIEVKHPRISIRTRLAVTDVADNGDVSFAWESVETKLDDYVMKSLVGRSGSVRQSARGIHEDLRHDTPLPEDPGLRGLLALITEFVTQASTPLPKEPVGIGARWEITSAKDHLEGIRLVQTVTFELESLGENEARLRMYLAVTAGRQALEHPELPAGARGQVKRVHGDGEGALVIDFDRLGDRSLWMTVESRAEMLVTEGEEERELSVRRKTRIETKRER